MTSFFILITMLSYQSIIDKIMLRTTVPVCRTIRHIGLTNLYTTPTKVPWA